MTPSVEVPLNAIAIHVGKWIESAIQGAPDGHVPVLFLSGPQGSGKSTALHEAIATLPMSVAGLSIDDVYLTHAERMALARQVNPLCLTRGPPGTHDLLLLSRAIAALRTAGAQTCTPIPVFDKLADDRVPISEWRTFTGRPAAIVIEGWLLGADADLSAPDSQPLNAIEAKDRTGDWRRWQEHALAGPYSELWDTADAYFHIMPPGFECVSDWRLQQEEATWTARGASMPGERHDWVSTFIQHYERITRRMIAGRRRPGAEIYIDAERNVIRTAAYGSR